MKKRDLALAFGGAVGAAVAIKLLTRPKSVDWEKVSGVVPHSECSNFVQVDGARIHYQEFGDAADPKIILIHGYTASVYVWKTAAPLLADAGFHVIAIDLLGFGYSAKPASFDYSIQSQARMVSRFMNRLGIGKATIAEIVAWRRSHQPGGHNAGSVFTNPPGDSAGRLVDAAGAKGLRAGTAEVSPKHANFIQSDDDGSADDVAALMAEVRRRVAADAGIELHAETRMVGFAPEVVAAAGAEPAPPSASGRSQ